MNRQQIGLKAFSQIEHDGNDIKSSFGDASFHIPMGGISEWCYCYFSSCSRNVLVWSLQTKTILKPVAQKEFFLFLGFSFLLLFFHLLFLIKYHVIIYITYLQNSLSSFINYFSNYCKTNCWNSLLYLENELFVERFVFFLFLIMVHINT